MPRQVDHVAGENLYGPGVAQNGKGFGVGEGQLFQGCSRGFEIGGIRGRRLRGAAGTHAEPRPEPVPFASVCLEVATQAGGKGVGGRACSTESA